MNSLKVKHKVVIISTNTNSHIYKNMTNNRLGYVTGKYPEDLEQFPRQNGTQNQHLYILSNEDRKFGDYFLRCHDNAICITNQNPDLMSKKIIATTDKSLGLPIISTSFQEKYVRQYNKGEPITDVMVEYNVEEECKCICHKPGINMSHITPCCYPGKKTLKLSSGRISITKCKEYWSKEEVLELLHRRCRYLSALDYVEQDTIDWFNKTNS